MDQKEPQKESLITRLPALIGWWFKSLIGRQSSRPTTGTKKVNNVQEKPQSATFNQSSQKPIYTSDSVASDIQVVKKLFGVFKTKVSKTTSPAVAQSEAVVGDITERLKKTKVKGSMVKKTLVVGITFITVLIILAAGLKVLKKNGVLPGETPVPTTQPTPTASEYLPTTPSVYSQDPTILLIEENLRVLDREIFFQPIEDTTLDPPELDFNISF